MILAGFLPRAPLEPVWIESWKWGFHERRMRLHRLQLSTAHSSSSMLNSNCFNRIGDALCQADREITRNNLLEMSAMILDDDPVGSDEIMPMSSSTLFRSTASSTGLRRLMVVFNDF